VKRHAAGASFVAATILAQSMAGHHEAAILDQPDAGPEWAHHLIANAPTVHAIGSNPGRSLEGLAADEFTLADSAIALVDLGRGLGARPNA
jgi:hypothetical protein